jgi:hypothetical protein
MSSISFSIADQDVTKGKSIGIVTCSRSLASRLSRDPAVRRLTVFSNPDLSDYLDLSSGVEVRNFKSAVGSKFGRLLWDQWKVYTAARKAGNEWLFLPKGFASFVRRPPVRLAAYVHDTLLEWYRRNYPNYFSRLELWYFGRGLAATIRHASVIFSNTNFSGREVKDMAHHLGLPEPRVITAGYGFSTVLTQPTNRPERIAVIVSQWPNKRADLAVEYTERWRQESGFNGIIDCVGKLPDEVQQPPASNWRWHGRVKPDAARDIMRQARSVVYFSEYEGFGMPPVEATLDGACAVYSDLPATREVMLDAGFSFENSSYESFARALHRAMAVSPEQVEQWARELLTRHNWADVAKRIVRALREVGADSSDKRSSLPSR